MAPAGSAFDLPARIVAERVQASLGQPVVIDNVTGASGSIGAGRVARAAQVSSMKTRRSGLIRP